MTQGSRCCFRAGLGRDCFLLAPTRFHGLSPSAGQRERLCFCHCLLPSVVRRTLTGAVSLLALTPHTVSTYTSHLRLSYLSFLLPLKPFSVFVFVFFSLLCARHDERNLVLCMFLYFSRRQREGEVQIQVTGSFDSFESNVVALQPLLCAARSLESM